jgi:hypothetical protein
MPDLFSVTLSFFIMFSFLRVKAVRLFTSRIFLLHFAFFSDRNYFHYSLVQKCFSRKKITGLFVLGNFAFVAIAFIDDDFGSSTWLILIQLAACISVLAQSNKAASSHTKQNKVAIIKSISLHANVPFKRDSINIKQKEYPIVIRHNLKINYEL